MIKFVTLSLLLVAAAVSHASANTLQPEDVKNLVGDAATAKETDTSAFSNLAAKAAASSNHQITVLNNANEIRTGANTASAGSTPAPAPQIKVDVPKTAGVTTQQVTQTTTNGATQINNKKVGLGPVVATEKAAEKWSNKQLQKMKAKSLNGGSSKPLGSSSSSSGSSGAGSKSSSELSKSLSKVTAQSFKTKIHFLEGPKSHRVFHYWSAFALSERVNPGKYTEEWKKFPKALARFQSLLKESNAQLNQMTLDVIGHASLIEAGSKGQAKKLAQRRAVSVACYVGAYMKCAMPLDRVQINVRVGTCQKARCLSQDAKNRRVDIQYGGAATSDKAVASYTFTKGQPDAAFQNDCGNVQKWQLKQGWQSAWMEYKSKAC